jgi:hypothetical membrane protein
VAATAAYGHLSHARVCLRTRALVLAIAMFAVLVGAAMLTYHGGSPFDPLAARYAPTGNFLSDLGMVRTYAGRPNATARGLFAAAALLVGGALAWSAPAWRAWNRTRRATLASAVAVAAAALAGAAFAVVGLTPEDQLLGLHVVVVDTAFVLLLVFVAALAVVQRRNGASRPAWLADTATAGLLALYAVTVLRTDPGSPTALRYQVVGQKVVIGVALLDVAFQARALRRWVRS